MIIDGRAIDPGDLATQCLIDRQRQPNWKGLRHPQQISGKSTEWRCQRRTATTAGIRCRTAFRGAISWCSARAPSRPVPPPGARWRNPPATTERYGLSSFGDLQYPANFTHLKYVNPAAPKGGTFSQLAGGGTATFNSLNGFILKGDPAIDMELVFASLMARANDEPDAVYGFAADQVKISADGRDLPLPAARRHHVPRWQPDQGRRRRVFAEHLEGKGPPQHRPAAARDGGGGRRRRPDGGRSLRAEARARRPADRGKAADPVERLLRHAQVRRNLARSAARLAVPTRSAASSRAASWNSSASRTGGAPTCRSTADSTTSTSCATTTIAIAKPRSKASAPRATRSARSSPRASGRPATIFRRSATAASSARPFPTTGRPARKAG